MEIESFAMVAAGLSFESAWKYFDGCVAASDCLGPADCLIALPMLVAVSSRRRLEGKSLMRCYLRGKLWLLAAMSFQNRVRQQQAATLRHLGRRLEHRWLNQDVDRVKCCFAKITLKEVRASPHARQTNGGRVKGGQERRRSCS